MSDGKDLTGQYIVSVRRDGKAPGDVHTLDHAEAELLIAQGIAKPTVAPPIVFHASVPSFEAWLGAGNRAEEYPPMDAFLERHVAFEEALRAEVDKKHAHLEAAKNGDAAAKAEAEAENAALEQAAATLEQDDVPTKVEGLKSAPPIVALPVAGDMIVPVDESGAPLDAEAAKLTEELAQEEDATPKA